MGIFIYSIIGKWYILFTVGALVVTFWVFKGLESTGILAESEKVVREALEETKAVAKYCVPKIKNLSAFWDCLDHPPKYTPSDEDRSAVDLEKQLQQAIKKALPTSGDPYEEKNK